MPGRKLTRFTEAPDGSLVYAKTGARAPSTYYLQRDANGRAVGVYRIADNAVGRVRVGSFQEAKNLPKKQREKVQKSQRKRGWPGEDGLIGPMGPQAWRPPRPPAPQAPRPGAVPQGMRDAAASGLLSVRDRGWVNFERRVESLYKEGKITRQEADDLLQRYAESSDADRTDMWDDLNEQFAGGSDQRYGSP